MFHLLLGVFLLLMGATFLGEQPMWVDVCVLFWSRSMCWFNFIQKEKSSVRLL